MIHLFDKMSNTISRFMDVFRVVEVNFFLLQRIVPRISIKSKIVATMFSLLYLQGDRSQNGTTETRALYASAVTPLQAAHMDTSVSKHWQYYKTDNKKGGKKCLDSD